jgi:hypothetical protein
MLYVDTKFSDENAASVFRDVPHVGISATVVVQMVFCFIDVVLYCRWIPTFWSNILPPYSELPLNMEAVVISTTSLVKIVVLRVMRRCSLVLQMNTDISEEYTASIFRINPVNVGSMFLKYVYIHLLRYMESQSWR